MHFPCLFCVSFLCECRLYLLPLLPVIWTFPNFQTINFQKLRIYFTFVLRFVGKMWSYTRVGCSCLCKKQFLPSYASLQQKEATKWRLEMVKSIGTALKSKSLMTNGIWGYIAPKFSRHLPYSWGKTQEKTQPGKLTRPGIKPWTARWEAAMLPLEHSGGRHVLQDVLVSRIILCNWCKL